MPSTEPDRPTPLRTTLADGLLTVTLNRPERHNALDDELKHALAAAVLRVRDEPGIRAMLLRGAGPSFCAGGDIRRIDGATGLPDGAARARSMLANVSAMLVPLLALDKPVIAAVHGHVLGAGVGLALAADVVIAADSVRFGVPFVEFALGPDMLAGYLLTRAIGIRRARSLLLNPHPIQAQEALAWGLVDAVVPAGDLDAVATSLAARLASGPTVAYGCIKRQTAVAFDSDPAAFAALEARDHGRCVDTADYTEAIQARRDGRAASFTGA